MTATTAPSQLAPTPSPGSDAARDLVADERSEVLAGRALPVFAFLWAFAALFHQAAYPDRAIGPSAVLVTLPAVWLLLKPSSLPRFLLLVALECVDVWRVGPANVSNHWVFTFFVDLTVLVALAGLLARRGRRVTAGELFLAFAPAARVELIVLYAYAVLHKLNTGFLSPAFSCATNHYASFAEHATFLPRGVWVDYALIYGTLVVESAIPVLLLVRRTRVAGALTATLFHFGLALNPDHTFFDFSSMLMSMYFLFLPFDYWGGLRTADLRSRAAAWVRAHGATLLRWARRLAFVVGVLLVATYSHRVAPTDPARINAMQEATRLLFLAYAAAVVVAFVLVARSHDLVRATRGIVSFVPRGATAVIVALVVFNGLNPYLGLKTEASFSMFSNLRTEGPRPNHVLIHGHAHLTSYQDDLIEVLDSSNPFLRDLAERHMLIPAHELRRRMATAPSLRSASLTYERGGRVYARARIADDPDLARPLSLVERKLLRFRVVEPPGVATPCRH